MPLNLDEASRILNEAMNAQLPVIQEMLNRPSVFFQNLERAEPAKPKLMKQFICRDCDAEDHKGTMICPSCKSRDIEVKMVEKSQKDVFETAEFIWPMHTGTTTTTTNGAYIYWNAPPIVQTNEVYARIIEAPTPTSEYDPTFDDDLMPF